MKVKKHVWCTHHFTDLFLRVSLLSLIYEIITFTSAMVLGSNLKKSKQADEVLASKEVPTIEGKISEVKDFEDEEQDVEKKIVYQQFCVFSSGNESYAIPISAVKEVVPFPELAPIPQAPAHVMGMANVRGNIYGVMDISAFFKTTETESPKYLLVLTAEDYQIGIAIADVPQTLSVAEDTIESLSKARLKSTASHKFLKGIIKKDKKMIVLLDILGMISEEKFMAGI